MSDVIEIKGRWLPYAAISNVPRGADGHTKRHGTHRVRSPVYMATALAEREIEVTVRKTSPALTQTKDSQSALK